MAVQQERSVVHTLSSYFWAVCGLRATAFTASGGHIGADALEGSSNFHTGAAVAPDIVLRATGYDVRAVAIRE
jgi:hypothetical protein